jgi:D-alanyl-D-alanine carboxypeptidase/D-alanyl-D-alanine-endopeptidase (penicillin-binding protein 4)
MQKYSFFSLLIILFNCWLLCGQISLQETTDYFVKTPQNKYASVSICIVDIDKDSVLANINGNKVLMSASTAKLFSTYTALDVLGSEYRPQTNLYINGEVDSLGVLQGDLYIRGEGDVTLGSKYFNEEGSEYEFMKDWLSALKAQGINAINGSIIADGSQFGYAGVPDGWDWSDMGNYYGSGACGINFYDNMVKYYFDTYNYGETAKFLKTFPSDDSLIFRHSISAANIRNDQSYMYGAPYSRDRFGVGSLPLNRKSFTVKGSMHDPEYMLSLEFTGFLNNDSLFSYVRGKPKGVRLMPSVVLNYEELKMIHSHKGEKLIDIVRLTNLNSVNLFAEGLLNLVGFNKYGKGSTSSGIEAIYKNLEGKVNLSGMKLKDGSGLSRKNAISAENFCSLLTHIHRSNLSDLFRSTLAVAGNSGTLKNICKGQSASGRMQAKSGTLSNVKAYAGYVKSKSGSNLAFAIIVNNFEGSRYKLVKKMEQIFNQMANY